MVGTWDFWPNYHYIQCITISNVSLYPMYHYIQIITKFIVTTSKYMTVYNVNTYIFISINKFNVKYEIMGAKEGQKFNIFVQLVHELSLYPIMISL